MLRRPALAAAVRLASVCLVVCLVAACGNPDPFGSGTGGPKSIVVGSGDFPESEIVAEIYAQALQANGFDVGRRMGIGSRETYIPALKDHSVDLVPEYIGNLLLYFEPNSKATMLDAVELELYHRLPGDLSILTPSPASDTDTVTVTGATAAKWSLKTIADLAAHSAEVRFAAPSAFATRPSGLPGLRQKYGLDISPGNFKDDQRRRWCGDGARTGRGNGRSPPTSSAPHRQSCRTTWWPSRIPSTISWPATLCRW